jgi:hypothetical protein
MCSCIVLNKTCWTPTFCWILLCCVVGWTFSYRVWEKRASQGSAEIRDSHHEAWEGREYSVCSSHPSHLTHLTQMQYMYPLTCQTIAVLLSKVSRRKAWYPCYSWMMPVQWTTNSVCLILYISGLTHWDTCTVFYPLTVRQYLTEKHSILAFFGWYWSGRQWITVDPF